MNSALTANASLYASQYGLELGEALGSGKDGIVFVARSKGRQADVAIKIHRFDELYQREKQAYERLQSLNISEVLGFNVPELINCSDNVRIIEMTIVERPFVLDFAAAYLDKRPEFPEDVWVEWEANKREQFEERWPKVQAILDAFEELGIYLTDISAANIGFIN